MDLPLGDVLTASKYLLIPLSLVVMLRCIRSMLSSGYESETWATARFGRDSVPVTHWENLIGRARSADIRIDRESVARTHAVLTRRDDWRWMIYDVFARGDGPEQLFLPRRVAHGERMLFFIGPDLPAQRHAALKERLQLGVDPVELRAQGAEIRFLFRRKAVLASCVHPGSSPSRRS